MSEVRSYRDLIVWRKAMMLVRQVYRLTKTLPKEERYGLSSQMQRAAVSIPANIAEGHARKSRAEYRHHLSYARGSLAELETELQLSTELGYCTRLEITPVWHLCEEVGKMLNSLINSLDNKPTKVPPHQTLSPGP